MSSDLLHAPTQTDEELDEVVRDLDNLGRGALLVYVVAVAKYIVNRYFGGDYSRLHDHDPTKTFSFNELVTRRKEELAEIGLSTPTLRRYLQAAEVLHHLDVETQTSMSLAKLTKLALVKDIEHRKRIADAAHQNKWGAKKIAKAVDDHKAALRGDRKKPGPKPKEATEILATIKAVLSPTKRLGKLKAEIQALQPEEREVVYKKLWQVMDILRDVCSAEVDEDEAVEVLPALTVGQIDEMPPPELGLPWNSDLVSQ